MWLSEVLFSDNSPQQAAAATASTSVYEDVVGQSQNIELKENVAYGPVQQ